MNVNRANIFEMDYCLRAYITGIFHYRDSRNSLLIFDSEVDMVNAQDPIHGFEISDITQIPDEPQWLASRRADSHKRLEQVSFPTQTEEIWRYSRVDELLDLGLNTFRARPQVQRSHALEGVGEELKPLLESAGMILLLEPGSLTIIGEYELPETVKFSMAYDFPTADWRHADPSEDFFTLFGQAFSQDSYVIDVDHNVILDKPILVVSQANERNRAFFPQLVLNVGSNSKATLIELAQGGTTSTLVASTTQIFLGDGAHVEHYQVQNLTTDSFSIANIETYLAANATLESAAFSFGCRYARVRSENKLLGEKSKAFLKAAYFADGDQMLDFRTLQDHKSPNTFSDLLFKGAVAGHSHSVYSGLVRMEEGAYKSDALQTNRNLVLSEGARADSVPNLDIRENNVRCAHASAVGPIDPDLIFYLESRGIDPQTGARMVVRGFFNEVLSSVAQDGVSKIVGSLVDAKLEELK